MNETKTFLLRMMAEAQTLEEFWFGYRALMNLSRLTFLAQQAPQSQGPVQPGFTPYNPAQAHTSPPPRPHPRFEANPGEQFTTEQMPWEEGG